MSRPPIDYKVTLADLIAISDAAAWFDDHAHQIASVEEARGHVNRLHDIAERAAGDDAGLIYPDEELAGTGEA